MSTISDALAGLFGGGGSGNPGDIGDVLDWLRDSQEEAEELDEREQAMADANTELRRGELADRSGYAGTALVGDAAQDTDASLAAAMAALPEDSPERQAYEDAVAAETTQRGELERQASGAQFELEDAVGDIVEQIADADDLDALQAQAEALAAENPWFNPGELLGLIEAEREQRAAEEERQRQAEEDAAAEAANRPDEGE